MLSKAYAMVILPLGLVAWLFFGGYSDYGEDIWGRQLNYYLLPILVGKQNETTLVDYVLSSRFWWLRHTS